MNPKTAIRWTIIFFYGLLMIFVYKGVTDFFEKFLSTGLSILITGTILLILTIASGIKLKFLIL